MVFVSMCRSFLVFLISVLIILLLCSSSLWVGVDLIRCIFRVLVDLVRCVIRVMLLIRCMV